MLALLIIILFAVSGNAQLENKFKLGLDFGFVSSRFADGGVKLDLEPKYFLDNKSSIGIRIMTAHLLDVGQLISPDYEKRAGSFATNGLFAFTATYDRFLARKEKNFKPFIGGGISFNVRSKIDVESISFGLDNFLSDDLDQYFSEDDVKVPGQLGILIRSGFEFKKFRFGIEYNFVSKAKITAADGLNLGDFNFSYFGVSAGFTLGQKHWVDN